MRILGLLTVVMVLGLVFAGCSETVGSGNRGGGWGADSVTLAEIDAAAELRFDDDKEKVFSGIASRPHLSGQAQVYLVKTAMGSLRFDDSKRDVLLALVNNPYFVAEGKQAVLAHLDSLRFDSGKQAVLQALNRRGYVPSEREFERRLRERRLREERLKQPEGAVEMETTVEVEAGYMEAL